MKIITAVLASALFCASVGSMVHAEPLADPSSEASIAADLGPDQAKRTSARDDNRRPASAGAPIVVRRELKRDDLAAIFALLFLGQVPRSSEVEMGAQLVRR